jgi:hypothetical protein
MWSRNFLLSYNDIWAWGVSSNDSKRLFIAESKKFKWRESHHVICNSLLHSTQYFPKSRNVVKYRVHGIAAAGDYTLTAGIIHQRFWPLEEF